MSGALVLGLIFQLNFTAVPALGSTSGDTSPLAIIFPLWVPRIELSA